MSEINIDASLIVSNLENGEFNEDIDEALDLAIGKMRESGEKETTLTIKIRNDYLDNEEEESEDDDEESDDTTTETPKE